MKAALKFFIVIIAVTSFVSCRSVKEIPRYQLSDGEYLYRQRGHEYQAVYIENKLLEEEDTILIYPAAKAYTGVFPEIVPEKDQFFIKHSFHFNILTVLFKFRPSVEGFPAQLNSTINGALFLGYRIDKFQLRYNQTPAGLKNDVLHWGLSAGLFGGIGSTPITPWTTSYRTMDEYNGFVLSRGFAVMGSLNRLTVGVGVGLDYLTDRDKDIWIHQNEVWYGLTLGLNLN